MTILSIENLDIIAAAVKESTEVGLERRVEPFRKEYRDRLKELEERAQNVAEILTHLTTSLGDPARFETRLDEMTESTESAIKTTMAAADDLLSRTLPEELAKLRGEVDEKVQGLDAKSAAVTDTMREIAGEFAILNESAASALLKLSEFRKQTESEIRAAMAAELESMRTDGALISEEVTAGLLGTLEKAVAEEFSKLDESVASALLKLSEFRKQVSADLSESMKRRLDDTVQELRVENVIIRDDVRTEANELLAEMTREVEKFLENLAPPEPIPGAPGAPGEKGVDGAPGAPGRDGVDGAVGRTLPWKPDRYYEKRATVTHLAGIWQAQAAGDGEPGDGEQWVCLSRGIIGSSLNEAGEMVVRYSDQTTQTIGDVRGPPGREWQHKGTFDPKAWYTRADVVVVRGSSYVAIDDSPGDCPGHGWQMVAQAKTGPSGKPGKQGEAGDPGPPGTSIRWFGEYDKDTKYPDGAVVRAGKDLWVALDSTSEAPSPDAIDWDLMLPGGSA